MKISKIAATKIRFLCSLIPNRQARRAARAELLATEESRLEDEREAFGNAQLRSRPREPEAGTKPTVRVYFVDFWEDFQPRALLFLSILDRHYNVLIDKDNPDFLFASCFGAKHLKYDCVKILFVGENVTPNFNLYDYAIGFDHMELEDRYLRFPLYRMSIQPGDGEPRPPDFFAAKAEAKTGFCNFLYSNFQLADPIRDSFFDLLSKYRKVDSGGKFRNNIGGPVGDRREWQQRYKFTIAFENSAKSGYVTEKLYWALAAHTIPIYWGDPRVGEDFNDARFINCAKYSSLEEVVERVRELDNDPRLYLEMLSQPWFAGGSKPAVAAQDPSLMEFIESIVERGPQKARRIPKYGFTAGRLTQYRDLNLSSMPLI